MRNPGRCTATIALALALLAGCYDDTGYGDGDTVSPIARQEPFPRPVLVSELHKFSAVGAGYHHSCGIEDDGSTWCWGSNEWGQLGSSEAMQRCAGGNLDCSGTPLRVSGNVRLVSLAGSIRHTCGLDGEGEAWCWGFGLGGQLGDGQRANSSQPVLVAGGHRFVRLSSSTSAYVTCGLTAAGDAWCWGPDTDGLLGNGTRTGSSVPARVDAPEPFISMSVGERHACGVTLTQDAYCWGINWFGQLGVGSAGGNGGFSLATTPVRVVDGRKFREIAAGGEHTCALTPTGAAFCWGVAHLTGNRNAESYTARPIEVESGQTFVSISTGFAHTCARTANAELYCWGENWGGKLGNGTTAESIVPVRVDTQARFSDVVAAGTHTCALSTGHDVFCWGGNPWGGVGRPPTDP
jgi:alpha-tubulin suppressor-like RCC1 family protein